MGAILLRTIYYRINFNTSILHHFRALAAFIVPPFQPNAPEFRVRALGVACVKHPVWGRSSAGSTPLEYTGRILAAFPKPGGDVAIPVAAAVAQVSEVIDFDCFKVALNGAVVDRQDPGRVGDILAQA